MDTLKQIRFKRQKELNELKVELGKVWEMAKDLGYHRAKDEINEQIIKVDESLEQMEEEESFENAWNDYHSKY